MEILSLDETLAISIAWGAVLICPARSMAYSCSDIAGEHHNIRKPPTCRPSASRQIA